jgi:hypothetical protein
MPASRERTARDWYEEAQRAYVEGHQACASCGRRHQVYKGHRGSRLEYYCPACDFFTFHDERSGQFYAVAGHEAPDNAHPATAPRPHATPA